MVVNNETEISVSEYMYGVALKDYHRALEPRTQYSLGRRNRPNPCAFRLQLPFYNHYEDLGRILASIRAIQQGMSVIVLGIPRLAKASLCEEDIALAPYDCHHWLHHGICRGCSHDHYT